MTFVLPESHLRLDCEEGEVSMEFLVSQLQPFTNKILCVRDGTSVKVFESGFQLPVCLNLELIKNNEIIHTTEYHYRNGATDELWVFFSRQLHMWLQGGRRGPMRLGEALSYPTPSPEEAHLHEDLAGMVLTIEPSLNPQPLDEILVAASSSRAASSSPVL